MAINISSYPTSFSSDAMALGEVRDEFFEVHFDFSFDCFPIFRTVYTPRGGRLHPFGHFAHIIPNSPPFQNTVILAKTAKYPAADPPREGRAPARPHGVPPSRRRTNWESRHLGGDPSQCRFFPHHIEPCGAVCYNTPVS